MDNYRTLHPARAEYIFFSRAHGTFSGIGYMLSHKTNLIIFSKNNETYKSMREKFGKLTNTWNLNKTLLNNQWVKEEMRRELENTLR